MATYSQYAVGGYSGEAIEANESYIGAIGAYECMEESYVNERTVFEHVLGCDFAEAAANQGLMMESDYEAINEASSDGIFGKVIAFFRKLGEKIKGILQNAIDKIRAMCTKDGKELVRKFEKKINEKSNKGDLAGDDFKYKWCDVLHGGISSTGSDSDSGVFNTLFSVKMPKCENPMFSERTLKGVINSKSGLYTKNGNYATSASTYGLKKAEKDYDTHSDLHDKSYADSFNDESNKANKAITSDEIADYKENLLGAIIKTSTTAISPSEAAKEIDEYFFDDEETKDGLNGGHLSEAAATLKGYTKLCSNLEKEKKDVDKKIKEQIKYAENLNKRLKLSDKNLGAGVAVRTLASGVITMGNALSSVSTTYYAGMMAAAKKHYKQCRALWIKAATYSKKKAKNEAALLEAYVSVSDDEVDMMMPEC